MGRGNERPGLNGQNGTGGIPLSSKHPREHTHFSRDIFSVGKSTFSLVTASVDKSPLNGNGNRMLPGLYRTQQGRVLITFPYEVANQPKEAVGALVVQSNKKKGASVNAGILPSIETLVRRDKSVTPFQGETAISKKGDTVVLVTKPLAQNLTPETIAETLKKKVTRKRAERLLDQAGGSILILKTVDIPATLKPLSRKKRNRLEKKIKREKVSNSLRRANRLTNNKRYEQALEVYDMAATHHRKNTEVYHRKAKLLRRLERYDEAYGAYILAGEYGKAEKMKTRVNSSPNHQPSQANDASHSQKKNGQETTAINTAEAARAEIFEKAGNRYAEELNALMDQVLEKLNAEKQRGKILPTITELEEAYKGQEAIREGEVLFIPQHQGELVVVGDIHGDLEAVEEIMKQTQFLEKMQEPNRPLKLVFLGDYIDRGSKSAEVVEALLAAKNLYPENIHLIQADHEQPFQGHALNVYIGNMFGVTYLGSDKKAEALHDKYFTVFDALPKMIACGNGIVGVHGGPDLEGRDLQQLARIPDEQASRYSFKDVITWADVFDEASKDKTRYEEAKQEAYDTLQGLLDTQKEVEINYLIYSQDQIRRALTTLQQAGVYPNFSRGNNEAYLAALDGSFYYAEEAVNRFLNNTRATVIVRGHEPRKMGIWFDGKLATVHSTGEGSEDSGMKDVKNPNYAIFPLDRRVDKITDDNLKPVKTANTLYTH